MHAQIPIPREMRSLADGCVVTMAPGCDSTTLGQLAPGDCTLSSGQYQDVIHFPVAAGQEFAITVRPLAPAYTKPIPNNSNVFTIKPEGAGRRRVVRH